jgi:hypothetical protein
VRKYLIAVVGAATLAGMGITAPAWASTGHYIYANTMPYVTGFGTPPSPGDSFEPVRNLAVFTAVSEGGGYYEWQAPDGAGQTECITANVNDGLVDSEPCGKYPASQEWNYNNYGGHDTLYNAYSGKCIIPTTPYMELATCGVTAGVWSTPDS